MYSSEPLPVGLSRRRRLSRWIGLLRLRSQLDCRPVVAGPDPYSEMGVSEIFPPDIEMARVWARRRQAAGKLQRSSAEVTYYFLLGCPFCPIVEARLKILQKDMDFTLSKIDLTLKPQLAASQGIQSVPVVEVGQDRLIGNATTEQLAQLIGRAQAIAPVPAICA